MAPCLLSWWCLFLLLLHTVSLHTLLPSTKHLPRYQHIRSQHQHAHYPPSACVHIHQTTGCPRLPPGGLASLQPRLTVVRKHPSGEKSGSVSATPVGSLTKVCARSKRRCFCQGFAHHHTVPCHATCPVSYPSSFRDHNPLAWPVSCTRSHSSQRSTQLLSMPKHMSAVYHIFTSNHIHAQRAP